ncbi:type II toxin-antitoxin system prevent-host-death family antitoxin [Amycolatopsis sp. GM8]|uniref:type II toxin-antitoxin system prevent-host-death family antitoxin n=1 Tax=Amycolatopsis sp. GM8 TaxID=2896530 RepID=UPI001F0230D5|nr:type II toxin-antitoxin system prevent-host-death family antitoxin [Amycolatopsis sp. GM8]
MDINRRTDPEVQVEISVTEAREALGPVTNHVEYGGQTVYLTKHGRRAAALVPAPAAELLEELEDAFDLTAVRAALAAVAAGENVPQPFVRRTASRDRRGE